MITEYEKKVQEELAIYADNINIHDLPEIYHYWSNKHLVPIFEEAEIKSIESFFATNLFVCAARSASEVPTFISIGSGNCDLEVEIAKQIVNLGLTNFVLECMDLNPAMLERGKQIAEEHGVGDQISFIEADFNSWKAGKRYSGVIANQALHHVVELEHLFGEVSVSLEKNGSFIISDMIGRNGHQRWPEALEIVHHYWKELSDKQKYNVLLKRHEEEYYNWDCSKEGFEGIRAQDILPLLEEMFLCEKFVAFGNVVDIFVDRCFGHNLSPDSSKDTDLIDRLHAEDEAGFANGKLTPTHMLAVFVKNLNTKPFYSRGITPKLAIRDV